MRWGETIRGLPTDRLRRYSMRWRTSIGHTRISTQARWPIGYLLPAKRASCQLATPFFYVGGKPPVKASRPTVCVELLFTKLPIRTAKKQLHNTHYTHINPHLPVRDSALPAYRNIKEKCDGGTCFLQIHQNSDNLEVTREKQKKCSQNYRSGKLHRTRGS